MLVLGRKENQSIIIGDNIRITIIGRSGSSIRIGVQAPSDVKVIRAELERQTAVDGSATQVTSATVTSATVTSATVKSPTVKSPTVTTPARASGVRESSVHGGESTAATAATAATTAATTTTDVTCGDLVSLMGAN